MRLSPNRIRENRSEKTPPFDLAKEEYIALRREVETSVAELSNLERNCVIAAATAYAWVATSTALPQAVVQSAWLVPALVPVYGAARSAVVGQHIGLMAKYLREVEANILPKDAEGNQRGWEHYFDKHGRGAVTKQRRQFWIGLVCICTLSSALGFWLSTKP